MKKQSVLKIVLAIILISYFMIILDNSIVFTSSIKMSNELGINKVQLSWISNAYALTFGGLILVGGRLGDFLGRKRIFIVGLVIFAIASLLISIADDGNHIIIERAFQGIGSAIIAPTTLALLMDNFTGESRTRAIAGYGAVAGIGSAVGLLLGGFFASLLSWRIGFLINLPIAALMILLAVKFIKKDPPSNKVGRIDIFGSILSIVGMVALVYGIVGEKYQNTSLIISFIIIGIFIFHESKTKNAIMPLSIFKDRIRSGAYLGRFLYLGALMSFWFFTPQIMQLQFGFTPLEAAMGFLPLTVVNFVVSLQVPKLLKIISNDKLLIIGVSVTALAFVYLLLFFNKEANYWTGMMLPMLLCGIGQGLSMSPFTVAGMHKVPSNISGAASGVLNMFHQLGGSIGLSIIVALTSDIKDYTMSYQGGVLVQLIFLGLTIIVVFFTMILKNSQHQHGK